MGCGSCSTVKGTTSPGCRNNGSCGTSGCNKLSVFNWLGNMESIPGAITFNIAEIHFKGTRKEFFRIPEGLEIKEGDLVAVEGNPGHDIGRVSLTGDLVRLQIRKKGLHADSPEIKNIYRTARPGDIEKWEEARSAEANTLQRSKAIISKLNLAMKLSDVEYQGDKKKAVFYYTADQRVDFRELIKRLAEEFGVRIEMKQIGMRQEAGRLGGIGDCGRELCCSTWLSNFKSVTTNSARYQNLSLNPARLAGQCGKLKCCLNYELDVYLDALKNFPDTSVPLRTGRGTAIHQKTDIFKRLVWYSFSNAAGGSAEGAASDNWIPVPVERAQRIILMNKQGTTPADLLEGGLPPAPVKEPDYEDVVGQDSLTRMDKKKRKNNKRRNPHHRPQGKEKK